MLAALLGAAPLVPGLVLLLWHHAGSGASVVFLYSFSNDVVANALLIGAGVYAAAFLLARQPRWLLAAALALVLGIELHLSAGFQVTLASRGGGDWTRFLVTLGAVALLVAAGRLLRGEEERNLLVAARPADAAGVLGDPGRDRPGRGARRGGRGAAGGDGRGCPPAADRRHGLRRCWSWAGSRSARSGHTARRWRRRRCSVRPAWRWPGCR